ncbi:MAG: glycosyltransferase family 2 protein [Brevinemataceae bacterium]
MNPKISIVVIVHNTEKYLCQCLDSIVNQTLKEIEIIVVNDKSLGNCIEIVESYQKTDNRIKLISLDRNRGSLVARNLGALEATGDYVQHVDSDDWLELDTCERIYNALIKTKSDLCYIGLQKVKCTKTYPFVNISDQVLNKEELFNKFIDFRFLSEDTFIKNTLGYGVVQYIAKRDIYQKVGHLLKEYSNIKIMEDFAHTALLIFYSQSCTCLSFYGYNYRMGSGITANIGCQSIEKYSSNFQQVFTMLKLVSTHYENSTFSNRQKAQLQYRLSYHFYQWVHTYINYSRSEQCTIRSFLKDHNLSYILYLLYPQNTEIYNLKVEIVNSIGIFNSIKQLIYSLINFVYKFINKIKIKS